jgi:hypothetical protein
MIKLLGKFALVSVLFSVLLNIMGGGFISASVSSAMVYLLGNIWAWNNIMDVSQLLAAIRFLVNFEALLMVFVIFYIFTGKFNTD